MTPIDLRDVAGLVLDYLPLPSQAILYKTSRVLRGIALRSWPAEARKHLGVPLWRLCERAADEGDLALLQWAHSQGSWHACHPSCH